jgi:uncharacterized protein YlzI (FlbEa/FlbD family)
MCVKGGHYVYSLLAPKTSLISIGSSWGTAELVRVNGNEWLGNCQIIEKIAAHCVIECTQLHEKVKLVSVSTQLSELRDKFRYNPGHNQA